MTEEAAWSHDSAALTSGEALSSILRAIARELKSLPSPERPSDKASVSGGRSRQPGTRADRDKSSAQSKANSDLDLVFCLNCLQATSRIAGQSDEARLELSRTHVAFATDLIDGTTAFLDIALSTVEEETRQRTAAQCLVESIKLFAVSANLSPEWALTVAPSAEFVTALGSIMLERQTLADKAANTAKDPAGAGDVGGSDDVVEPVELLCLVLAILTEALLVDPKAPAAIQAAGELPL